MFVSFCIFVAPGEAFISRRDNAVIFNYIQVFQTIPNVASLKNRRPPSIVPHVYNNPQELDFFFPQSEGEESFFFLFVF